VKNAVDDVPGYEDRRVLKLYYQLQAENALLKTEVERLRETVRIKKKKKKSKKSLFTEL
jgi:hypothetical protein